MEDLEDLENNTSIVTTIFSNSNNTLDYCQAGLDEDSIYHWDRLNIGENATKICPRRTGFDTKKIVTAICQYKTVNANNETVRIAKLYPKYINCYREALKPILSIAKIDGVPEVIDYVRIMEYVGLTMSLIALVTSLVIFYRYRVLRNNRTKIHKNLFTAILLQVIFRLLQYTDQAITLVDPKQTEVLCISEIILLEFGKISMVIWMFIEGLYLHNVITLTVFQEHSRIKWYFYFGWATAIVVTGIWIITMLNYVDTDVCWFLYQFEPIYWILEGPSSAIIIINMLFLLNIIRILLVKLRQTHTSELQQLRKAVKAAVFLVPLMGITNALFMVSVGVFERMETFAVWMFVSYFLATFQGCIISILYCFLNGEVRTAIRNSVSIYYYQLYLRTDKRRNSSAETGRTSLEGSS